jgi:hypothetical protein
LAGERSRPRNLPSISRKRISDEPGDSEQLGSFSKETIDPGDPELGRVQETDIADTTVGHIWLKGCVLHVMEDAEFDAPRGGGVVRVSYPFEFNSSDDD